MWVHKPRPINLVSYVLFAISALILIAVVAFTVNIKVLSHWVLTLPSGSIHAGQTILIESTYTKTQAVTGVAHRYLDCQNVQDSYIRYPINQATADHAPGSKTGTAITIKIPQSVPDLPASCRISVDIVYQVYPWRRVTEFNSTKDFKLLPATSAAPAAVSSESTRTSRTQVVLQGQVPVSSTDDEPDQTSPQSDTSQPPAMVQEQPGFVQSILNSTSNAINGLLHVLK